MKFCIAIALGCWLMAVAHAQRASSVQQYVDRQLPMLSMGGLLELVETVPLPTQGYMDHLACDVGRQRLFISGENNNEMVIVNLRSAKVTHVTKLQGRPRKPFFDRGLDELWVDVSDNTAVALSGATFKVVKTVALTGGTHARNRDPDNAAYDPVRKLYYVAVRNLVKGTRQGSIEVVDTQTAKLVAHIPMHVDEPAALALDSKGGRLYVGVGDIVNGRSVVKVIDTRSLHIVAEWPIPRAPQPHAAALDVEHHRLFLVSRLGGGHTTEPGKLTILNTDSGGLVESLNGPGGGDEVFYDPSSSRIYFSGSTGTVAVYHEDDPNHFRFLGEVPTGALAKSGLWVPQLKSYYAAVPEHLVETTPTTEYGVRDWVTEEAHLMVFHEIRAMSAISSSMPRLGPGS